MKVTSIFGCIEEFTLPSDTFSEVEEEITISKGSLWLLVKEELDYIYLSRVDSYGEIHVHKDLMTCFKDLLLGKESFLSDGFSSQETYDFNDKIDYLSFIAEVILLTDALHSDVVGYLGHTVYIPELFEKDNKLLKDFIAVIKKYFDTDIIFETIIKKDAITNLADYSSSEFEIKFTEEKSLIYRRRNIEKNKLYTTFKNIYIKNQNVLKFILKENLHED